MNKPRNCSQCGQSMSIEYMLERSRRHSERQKLIAAKRLASGLPVGRPRKRTLYTDQVCELRQAGNTIELIAAKLNLNTHMVRMCLLDREMK